MVEEIRHRPLIGALIAAGVVVVGVLAFVLSDDDGPARVETASETEAVTAPESVAVGTGVYPPAPYFFPGPGACGGGFYPSGPLIFFEGGDGSAVGCEPLEQLFRRSTDDIVIRAYRTDNMQESLCQGGACPPPECFPVGYVSAGLSTDEAVGLATGPLYEPAPTPVLASSGFFGLGEGAPAAWAVVQVDPSVERLRVRFAAGGGDEMRPRDGIAVLASTVSSGDEGASPDPAATLETLDRDGAVINTTEMTIGQPLADAVLSTLECAPRPPELPEPDGPPPADEPLARERVVETFTAVGAGATSQEERLSRIDDPSGMEGLREELLVHFPDLPLADTSLRIEEIRFLNPTTAAVRYTLVLPGYSIPEFPHRTGEAVLVGDTWKVTRETVCRDLALGNVTCPPTEG